MALLAFVCFIGIFATLFLAPVSAGSHFSRYPAHFQFHAIFLIGWSSSAHFLNNQDNQLCSNLTVKGTNTYCNYVNVDHGCTRGESYYDHRWQPSFRRDSSDDAAALPHPSCSGTYTLNCPAGNYSIPGNFDLGSINSNVSIIEMGSETPGNGTMSYIHGNADPLPSSLSRLLRIELYSVEGTNSTRVPLEAFLGNVKGQLRTLRLENCRINPLGAHFLKGFNRLTALYLEDNDVRDIDVNAFETRITLQENTLPALRSIWMKGNSITDLDWAVFAPVAYTLRVLQLQQQVSSEGSLTNLTLSRPFTFTNLTYLALQRNGLNFLQAYILDTLPISNQLEIDLEYNAFCLSPVLPDCSCCEAEAFITWTHEIADGPPENIPSVTFTCGRRGNFADKYWRVSSTYTDLPPFNQYICCSNSSAPGCADEQTTKTPPKPNSSAVTHISVIMMSFLALLTLPLVL